MFIHSTCFFNNLTTSLVFTKLHIISCSFNPLLADTENVSTQTYYVKKILTSNISEIYGSILLLKELSRLVHKIYSFKEFQSQFYFSYATTKKILFFYKVFFFFSKI